MHFRRSCIWIILSVSIWRGVESCTKESKSTGICLHTYLERDFPAIEMIVYPERKHGNRGGYRTNHGHTLLFDGPELQSNCHTLNETLHCFSDVIHECYYFEDLYEYEQLLKSLTKIYTWMCHDIQAVREHFLVLLQSLNCLEWVRINDKCSEPEIPANIWTKILRLEANTTMCPLLQKQRNCLLQSLRLEETCGHTATDIYRNMSMMFFEGWCNKTTRGTEFSIVPFILSFLNLIYFNLKF